MKYIIIISGGQTQNERNDKLEIRQVQTFFGVAALFFLGHSLRIFLNLFEVWFEEDIVPTMNELHNFGCVSYRPLWNNVSKIGFFFIGI